MLCQRIAYLSEKYVTPLFQKRQDKTLPLLLSAIKLMEKAHNRLVHGDIAANLPGDISKKIHAMYFDPPMYLDQQLHKFLTEARTLTKTPRTKAIGNTHCYLYINSSATHTLLNDLNMVVKQYQIESEVVITKLQRLEIAILIVTLIVLLIIALFIFKPMITRVKLETLKLINAGKKIQAITDTVGDGIVAVDTENKIVFVNQELCHIFQYSESDLLGKNLTLLLKDSADTRETLLNDLFKQTEKAISNPWIELEGLRKDHSKLPLEIRINQTLINDIEDTAFTVSIRDISQRKRIGEQLRNISAGVSAETGESFFKHLVEHLAKVFNADYAFIGLTDKNDPQQINTLTIYAQGQIKNNFSYSLHGTPCANVMCKHTMAYLHDVQQQFPEDQLLIDMNVESYVGVPLFLGDDDPLGILVVMSSKPLAHIEQIGELLDIFSARASAELERLNAEESVHKLSQAIEQSPNGVIISDLTGHIEYVNAAFTDITGYSKDEAIGQRPSIIQSGQTPIEVYKNLWATIKAGKHWVGEVINRRKDGSLYTEEQSISPMYEANGKITHFVAIQQDITDRLQTEEALRRSQKMEVIGQLSGGIAHDFNNQLGVVIGYLDILKKHTPIEQEKPNQWLNNAIKASQRCTDLTRQLLAFSRTRTQEKIAVCLNDTLNELDGMFTRSLTPEVELQYCLDDELWLTEINPGEFQDAILNLIINARDAMPNGGKLRLETNNKHLDTGYIEANSDLKTGDYVELIVNDTGAGMDKHTLEHIFEPFFTTKPAGKGTGLGLAMVYGFFRRYGGYVRVDSEPGKGTTLRLYLPRSKAVESTSIEHDMQAAELSTGNEHILIVDDESNLLELADKYLSDQGYQTYTAESAAQALDILMNNKEIDLLFTDVIMPGEMNGYELAKQATQQYPGLKVLLTSGYASKAVADNGQGKFITHLLAKPYRKTELIKRIRSIIDDKT